MKVPNPESGQALVGTLVIMVLVFAMAGSVALAASSLLDQQTSHRTAIDTDLRASDAITGAVAHVAGHGQDNGPVCDSSTTSFPNRLPGFDSTATCLRVDEVASATLGVIALPWSGGCANAPLTGSGKVVLFFSALASGGLKTWVDGNPRCDSDSYGSGKCTSSITATVGLRAIECDLGQVQGPVLHVLNPLSSPAAVRFVNKSSTSGSGTGGGGGANGGGTSQSGSENGGSQAATTGPIGSIYELAASTGLPAGPQFEEGSVFVSHDGISTVLVSEGAL
jgi:hypothetical protein